MYYVVLIKNKLLFKISGNCLLVCKENRKMFKPPPPNKNPGCAPASKS
jgi:hypothetical protein